MDRQFRIFCVLLAALTLLSAASCGGKKNNGGTEGVTGEKTGASDSVETTVGSAGDEINTVAENKIDLSGVGGSVTLSGIETYTAGENRIDLSGLQTPTISWEGIETYVATENRIDVSGFSSEPIDLGNFEIYVAENNPIDLSGLEQAQIDKIIAAETDLFRMLTEAFKSEGINVRINRATGEVSLDSSVLFGGDSAVLSDEGKAFLRRFAKAYAGVMLDEKFNGFIEKISVEGHCAPVDGDTYESALPLSQERADAVKSFMVSDDADLSADSLAKLSGLLEAHGLSNRYPVTDASGNVDMAASRRVSFRFAVNP